MAVWGKKAPPGAEVLYSQVRKCEPRDGLIWIEVGSGDHTERLLVPLRVAMELHHRLGQSIDGMLNCRVAAMGARADH